jgi:hypothetical protein
MLGSQMTQFVRSVVAYWVMNQKNPSSQRRVSLRSQYRVREQRGHDQVDMFIEIEFHSTRLMRKHGVWDYDRGSISGADRCSAMSLSIASRLS